MQEYSSPNKQSRPLTTPQNFKMRKIISSESYTQLRPLSGLSMTQKNLTRGTNFFQEKNKIKRTPQNISYDKEELYYQNLQLKQKITILQEENNKLKTQKTTQQKEIIKCERQIQDQLKIQNKNSLQNSSNTHHKEKSYTIQKAPQENSISIRLKKQLRDSQKEVFELKKQLEDFKKNHKVSENQELQEELSLYKKINLDLQIKYKKAMQINNLQEQNQIENPQEEQNDKSNKLIKILKQDNVQLAVILRELQDDIIQKNNQKSRIEDKLKKIQKEHSALQKQFNQEREKNSIKAEMTQNYFGATQNSKQQNIQHEQISSLKEENQQKQNEINKLSKQYKQADEKQKEYEVTIKQLRTQLDTLNEIQEQKQNKIEQKGQNQDNHVWKNKYYELLSKYEYLELKCQNEEQNYPSDVSLLNRNSKVKIAFQENKKPFQYPIDKRQSLKVNSYDLDRVVADLAFRLQLQRIDLQTSLKFLLPEELRKNNRQNLRDTFNILQAQPFNVDNIKDVLLLSRYLIEDNQNDYIIIDENRTQEVNIIRDTFKRLLNNYQLFTFEEEIQARVDLSKIITSYSSSIVDNIKIYTAKKQELENGTCYLEDWQKVQEYCEIPITQSQLKYFYLCNFIISKNSNIIYYDQIVRMFNQDKITKELQNYKEQLEQQYQQQEQQNELLMSNGIEPRVNESLQKQKDFYEKQQKEIQQKKEKVIEEEKKLEKDQNQKSSNESLKNLEQNDEDYEQDQNNLSQNSNKSQQLENNNNQYV